MRLDERREHLTVAAWELIKREGIAAATTRAICKEAGMGQSHFHYCFDSRATLLQRVVRQHVNEHFEGQESTYCPTLSGCERVDKAMREWWHDIVENSDMYSAIVDVATQARYNPELEGLDEFQNDVVLNAIKVDLENITADGRVAWQTDVEELATTVQVFFGGLCLRYSTDPEDSALPGLVERFAHYLASHLDPVDAAKAG